MFPYKKLKITSKTDYAKEMYMYKSIILMFSSICVKLMLSHTKLYYSDAVN